MFTRVFTKQSIHRHLYTIWLLSAALLLLYRPAAVATGISRGLSVCGGVIIPTLYPFMLLAGLLSDSPLCRQPGVLTKRITQWAFGLPGCCGPAILLSMVGGYPAGAIAISRLEKQGLINDRQITQMTAFCVGGGPGFIIGTVGAGLLGSTRAGVLLFVANVAASLIIGLWLGRGHRHPFAEKPIMPSAPRSLAAVVSDTCAALLTACGFVVLASAVLSLSEAVELPVLLQRVSGVAAAHWSAALAALLEVSSGCISLAARRPLSPLWLSLCMSWSGLSVQGQLAAILKGHRVLSAGFWGWRLVHGALAGMLSLWLFALLPAYVDTVAGQADVVPYSVSVSASVMLLALSFLAMLCFSAKKTGKSEEDML